MGTVAPDKVSTSTADVYIVNGQELAVGKAATQLQKFVAAGGGLFVGSHAFHWGSQNPLFAHPSNLLLNMYGIVLSAEPTQANAPIDPSTMPINRYSCDVALECLKDSCQRNWTNPCATRSDSGLADLKNICLKVDDYMPATAAYRLRVRQVREREHGRPGARGCLKAHVRPWETGCMASGHGTAWNWWWLCTGQACNAKQALELAG